MLKTILLLLLTSLVACKHTAAAKIESTENVPYDFGDDMFLVSELWNTMDSVDEAKAAGVMDSRYWSVRTCKQFLDYMAPMNMLTPAGELFPEGHLIAITTKGIAKPLYLDWSRSNARFDTTKDDLDAMRNTVLEAFMNDPSGLPQVAIEQHLFVVELRIGSGNSPKVSGYIGEKVNGKRQGVGVLRTDQGVFVAAKFRDGTLTGDGKVVFPGGVTYSGRFVNNYLDGDVTTTFPSNNVWKETYRQGQLIKADPGTIVDQSKAATERAYQFGDQLDYTAPVPTMHAANQDLANAAEPGSGSSATASRQGNRLPADNPNAKRSGADDQGGGGPAPTVKPRDGER